MQTLRAAQVEGCAIPVEEDGNVPAVAHVALDGVDGHGGRLTVEEAGTGATIQVVLGDNHPHIGPTDAQQLAAAGSHCDIHEFDQSIQCDLFGRARVADERGRPRGFFWVDKARSAAPGRRDGIDR